MADQPEPNLIANDQETSSEADGQEPLSGDKPMRDKISKLYRPSSLHGYLGPGLFRRDPRACESCDRAFAAFSDLIQQAPYNSLIIPNLDTEVVKGNLFYVSLHYWSRYDYDNRDRLKHFKADAKALIGPLRALDKLMDSLNPNSRQVINAYFTTGGERARLIPPDEFMAVFKANRKLLEVCMALAARKEKKISREATRTCCRLLRDTWGIITGREFKEQHWEFAKAPEVNSVRGPDELAAPDARFVQSMMQAINSSITNIQVRSGLVQSSKPQKRKLL